MFKIIKKEELSKEVVLFEIEAKEIAKKAKPGNFFVLRIDEFGERIPLTIADYDKEKGTLTSVVQKVGKTTYRLALLNEGDYIQDMIGPLGNPTHIEKFGRIICIGGGVGIAPIYPIIRALKEADNYIISIIGAREKNLLFWEDKIRAVSDRLIVTTDDGSYGIKGVVTEPLKAILQKDSNIDLVIAIGPAIMMKFIAETTKEFNIKTIVSLNSIMVDATGMCGCCRVEVGGETKFCCVDGPEFDAHKVNFDLLIKRQQIYLEQEKVALEKYKKETKR